MYNAELTIRQTLESLVTQDYPIHKIKVFDNQSTDNSQKIVLSFKERFNFIELIVNETNIGGEGNFTKCLEAAEGDYTAIVHTDDLYEPSFISKAVEVLEANPDCVATSCAALEINETEEIIGKRLIPSDLTREAVSILTEQEFQTLVFKYGNFITCPSVIARSDVYRDKIKSWNGSVYKTSADLDVWMRLSKLGGFAFINEELIHYRVAEASFSYRIAKKRTSRHDIFLILDRYKNEKNLSDYNFLALKDQAIRSLNMIRTNTMNERFPEEVKFDFMLIVSKMFQSAWHFKMGVAILGIKVLCMIKKS
jgi:glycosyltransferase involved in cell wall biosynthesis